MNTGIRLCLLISCFTIVLTSCKDNAGTANFTSPVASPIASPAVLISMPTPAVPDGARNTIENRYLSCVPRQQTYACTDTLLGIAFHYPLAWGKTTSTLMTSTVPSDYDNIYRVTFAQAPEVTTGGVGKINDLNAQRLGLKRGDWEFAGGAMAWSNLCEHPQEYVCFQTPPNMLLWLHVLDADTVCAGPGMEYDYPGKAYLMIDLPHAPVGGFVIVSPFVSRPALQALEAISKPNEIKRGTQCDDATRAAYDAKRDALVEAIRNGTADAETQRNVDALRMIAESIQFLPARSTAMPPTALATDVVGTPMPGTPVIVPTMDPVLATDQAKIFQDTPEPLPTPFFVSPNGARRLYVDSNLHFSFTYPDNWFVHGSGITPNNSFDNAYGYYVSVSNGERSLKGDARDVNVFKMEIVVLPDSARPEAVTSLQRQATHDSELAGTKIDAMTEVTISGRTGIRWIERGERLPGGALNYMVRDEANKRIYLIFTTWVDGMFTAEADRIVQSLAIK